MEVFDTKWTSFIKRKLEYWSPSKPIPSEYLLATDERCANLRNIIEEWVSLFPPQTRKLLATKIRARNFSHTLNELRIGVQLKRVGYEVEYEPNLLGVTPDWLISGPSAKCMIEVFTASYSGVEPQVWSNIFDLMDRLQRIVLPYAITLQTSMPLEYFDKGTNKRISQQIADWLTTTSLYVGKSQAWDDINVQIVRYNPEYTKLQVIGPGHSWVVDKMPMHDKVKDKIQTQRPIIQQLNVPLVVAIAPTPYSALGIDSIQDVVLGQEAVSYHMNDQGELVGESKLTRHWHEGLFQNEPHISAIIWMEGNTLEHE